MNTPTLIIKTPIDQLESEIVSLHARLCADEYQFLVRLREFDLRRGWEAYHFNHCAEWLNMKCGISLSTETPQPKRDTHLSPHLSPETCVQFLTGIGVKFGPEYAGRRGF